MSVRRIKKEIKKHRRIDWLAIVVFFSIAFILGSIIANEVDKFSEEMDLEVEYLQADIIRQNIR